MKFELGVTLRDKVTGFHGVVTGRGEYISGCAQYLLQPRMKDEHTYIESKWFDEQRLDPVAAARVVLDNRQTPGPDRPLPIR